MDSTVQGFYTKNPHEDYGGTYDIHHGHRLDHLVKQFKLGDLKGQRLADVGGGLGFLGKRLDSSNDYWVFDGADVRLGQRLCAGHWVQTDIQRDEFGTRGWAETSDGTMIPLVGPHGQSFDTSFCLETLEHISDPYHCLAQIKAMTKVGGEVIISLPTETVWHNVVYPGLMWPVGNWEQFLHQMALFIVDRWTFEPERNCGWPSYHWRCVNRPWNEKHLLYPKQESKFIEGTPLQCTNL